MLGLKHGVNYLVGYRTGWKLEFEAESSRIKTALGKLAKSVEHYGLTSVAGASAVAPVRRRSPVGQSGLGLQESPSPAPVPRRFRGEAPLLRGRRHRQAGLQGAENGR